MAKKKMGEKKKGVVLGLVIRVVWGQGHEHFLFYFLSKLMKIKIILE